MIARRQFISLLGGAAAVWPLAARAQQQPRRVGILMPYPKGEPEYDRRVQTLRQELTTLGWSDGVNILFDERWTTDDMNRVRAEAQSLMASQPDVVVAISGRVVPVLMKLSRTIPIVVPGGGDPVGVGWIESLARPGGNVTGFSFIELSVFGKMLEMLKQVAPSAGRVAFIHNPDNPSAAYYHGSFQTAAGVLGVETLVRPIRGLPDMERVIAEVAGQSNTAVFFPPDVTVQTHRLLVVALLEKHRLPAIYSDSAFVPIGGLLYYGADRADLFRRAAGYVHRILRGEKPADLPFQQPTKYELMINLKTARALGLQIPPTLLALADEVIE